MPKRFLPRILSLLLPTVLIAGCTLFPTTETNTTTETTGDDNTDVTTEENTNAVGDEGTNDNVNTVLDELDESTNTVIVGETTTEDIDTSDWLTYENEEYGFRFRYPQNWIVKEDGDYIGVYDADTYALASKPNTTDVIADLSVNLFDEIDEATYIENNDVSQSLLEAESKEYIKNLIAVNQQQYSFIDHNAHFDADELVYYFIHNQKIISITFFDTIKSNIKKHIAESITFN